MGKREGTSQPPTRPADHLNARSSVCLGSDMADSIPPGAAAVRPDVRSRHGDLHVVHLDNSAVARADADMTFL